MSDCNKELVFVLCDRDACQRHIVGNGNIHGDCHACLSGFWLVTNADILMKLEAAFLDKERKDLDEMEKFINIIKALKVSFEAGVPLCLSPLLNELDMLAFAKTGDDPWITLGNLLYKLRSFGIYEPLEVASNPCPCENHLRLSELYVLDVLYERSFLEALTNRCMLRFEKNQECAHCRVKVRSRRTLLTRLPEYLPIKFNEASDVIVPVRWKVPAEHLSKRVRKEYCNFTYIYQGHAYKTGNEKEKSEHSVCVLLWRDFLHRFNDITHETCELPKKSFLVPNLDVVLYRLVRDNEVKNDARSINRN